MVDRCRKAANSRYTSSWKFNAPRNSYASLSEPHLKMGNKNPFATNLKRLLKRSSSRTTCAYHDPFTAEKLLQHLHVKKILYKYSKISYSFWKIITEVEFPSRNFTKLNAEALVKTIKILPTVTWKEDKNKNLIAGKIFQSFYYRKF